MARPLTIIEGAAHHRAKYPSEIIDRSRDLYEEGMKPSVIVRKLAAEGHNVPFFTVIDWIKNRTRVMG